MNLFCLFVCLVGHNTGGCGEAFCDDDITPFAQGRAIGRDVPDSEGSLMASYSVYVVDPGAAPRNFPSSCYCILFLPLRLDSVLPYRSSDSSHFHSTVYS